MKTQNWMKKAAIFLTSQTVSLFGSSVVSYAIVWYITLKTGSGVLMTLTILCSFLPNVLISLFAGVWADKFNKKIIIMLADVFIAISTLALAIVFISGYQELWLIFLASAVRSFGSGIQGPAVNSLVPELVPKAKLAKVNGVNITLNSITTLASPAVGGILLGTIGFEFALLVDVVTAIFAVIILAFLKIDKKNNKETALQIDNESNFKQVNKPTTSENIAFESIEVANNSTYNDSEKSLIEQSDNSIQKSETTMQSLKGGLNYIKNNPMLKNLLFFYAIFFFLISPAAFLTPIYVARVFGEEVWRLTANEMSWTIGSILGGAIISFWGGYKNRVKTMIFSAAGFGVAFTALGIANNFWVYLIIMAISGIFMPFFSTAETVLIQEKVEPQMLGRVFSIIHIIVGVIMPAGMILFGPLSDIIDIRYIVTATGLAMLITAFIMSKNKILKAFGETAPNNNNNNNNNNN